MNYQERQSFKQAMGFKNSGNLETKKSKAVKQEQAKPGAKLTEEFREVKEMVVKKESIGVVSVERLQEAIIWSEILGKPVSRRGKRR